MVASDQNTVVQRVMNMCPAPVHVHTIGYIHIYRASVMRNDDAVVYSNLCVKGGGRGGGAKKCEPGHQKSA